VSISQIAESCLETVAQEQYDGPDPRFKGKTRIAATVLSLALDAPHDPEARKELLDRTMGKPRQRVDNVNVNLTLSGFLGQLAQEEETVEATFKEEDDDKDMFK